MKVYRRNPKFTETDDVRSQRRKAQQEEVNEPSKEDEN